MKKILCFLLGHKYFLIRELTEQSRQIGCWRCKCKFGMNDDVRAVIPWDSELENMYKTIGVIK